MATAFPFIPPRNLRVHVGSGDELDVRQFHVRESLSEPFEIEVEAVSPHPDVDLGAISGGAARLEMSIDRFWSGICAEARQVAVEEDGLSTYSLRLVPRLWLLGQKRSYRVFQQVSELDIVLDVLGRWGISPRLQLAADSYKARRYRVQYGESDLAFVHRMLEDAGITYFFEQGGEETELVLADRPNRGAVAGAPIPFVAMPNDRITHAYVTKVELAHRVRPGRFVQADVDWRRAPDAPIEASAAGGSAAESALELYHLDYGSFLFRANDGGDTPNADDRGPQRTDDSEGGKVARRRLDAARNDQRVVTFRTTQHQVRPGQVIAFADHPRADLGEPLLVASSTFSGHINGDWTHEIEARAASSDYCPSLSTPRPKATGVESATVVGPAGEEIHTDEFGRVRVQFHWDREGGRDDKASCWVPVSQNWGGSSFGAVTLPRVGQEVLVDFLGGDPDRPVVMGRVFTKTQPVPYELPKFKAMTGFRSETYPRPKSGGPGASVRGSAMPFDVGDVLALAAKCMPGAFGGLPASASQLLDLLGKSKSKGADETSHARNCNEIMMRDDTGAEQMHVQAQKDFAVNVKNNWAGTVGRNRVMNVQGNDSEGITGFQATTVTEDRSVGVSGSQTHTVQKTIKQESVTASQYFFAKEDIVHAAKVNRTSGQEMNVFSVGSSRIVMRPDFIIIQAKEVFINPGETATDNAIEGGTKPQNPDQKAASDKKAADEAARRQSEKNVAEGKAKADEMRADGIGKDYRALGPEGQRNAENARIRDHLTRTPNSTGQYYTQSELDRILAPSAK